MSNPDSESVILRIDGKAFRAGPAAPKAVSAPFKPVADASSQPWQGQLAALESRLTQLKGDNERLAERNGELEGELARVQAQHAALQAIQSAGDPLLEEKLHDSARQNAELQAALLAEREAHAATRQLLEAREHALSAAQSELRQIRLSQGISITAPTPREI